MTTYSFYCTSYGRELDDHEGSGYSTREDAESAAREELQWCDPERQKRDENFAASLGFFIRTEITTHITVCDKPIQFDKSSVGQCWVAADEFNCPADVQEEIAAEIVDGKNDTCDDYIASNGQHYRW